MALRRFETHVRIMSNAEYFSTKDNADGTTSLTMGSKPESFDGFTHVHKAIAKNETFFATTMSKVVDHAMAGQSTAILLCGPPGSGRSQTMYNVAGPGVVHLMAERLLKLEIERKVFSTVQAYNVRGSHLCDTMKDNVTVSRRDFGQPVGEMVMSQLRLLEKPQDAVVVSSTKKPSTSSFIEFHVYTPVLARSERRDAFARIVFVDLASFDTVTPSDLQELTTAINQHNSGAVDNWSACELTKLMESFLLGSKAVMCIGTVIGRKELAEQTANTLRFISALSKMRFTPRLVQIVAPVHLSAFPNSLLQFASEREKVLDAEHSVGEKSVFDAVRKLILLRLDELRGLLSGGDFDIQEARQAMHEQGSQLSTQLRDQREAESSKLQETIQKKNDLERKIAHCLKILGEINDKSSALEREQLCERSRFQMEGSATESELDRRRKGEQKRSREMMELVEQEKQFQEEVRRSNDDSHRTFSSVQHITSQMNFENAMDKIAFKKRRLEERLENAALKARACIKSTQEDRERKGRAARLSNMESKVQVKKAVAASIERSATKNSRVRPDSRSKSRSLPRSATPERPVALF